MIQISIGILFILLLLVVLYLRAEKNRTNETMMSWSQVINEIRRNQVTNDVPKIVVSLSDGATMPKKAHEGDASYDLCVDRDVFLVQGRQNLPTGVRLAMPPSIHSFIMPTSGNSSKGMNARMIVDGKVTEHRVSGHIKIGTIDNNYRGELGVTFDCYDAMDGSVFIEKGTKVAQLWIARETPNMLVEGDVDTDTARGADGFGSTDKKIGE
ncbi:MAG: hypothetical protein KBT34_10630 [Prevotella sp.]|nr:hypothetical protein [Candidatus Prevotella equi]